MRRIFSVFVIAFILNLIWENLHSFLYDNYMGGKITELILLRATLADAIILTVIILPFLFYPFFKKRDWLIIFIGFVISVAIEYYALKTSRWTYNVFMPIIPFLSVGLTPTIQLGFLGYITFKVEKHYNTSYFSSVFYFFK